MALIFQASGVGHPNSCLRFFEPHRVDRIIDVSQADATQLTRRLAKKEGLLAGMSSGGVIIWCLTNCLRN